MKKICKKCSIEQPIENFRKGAKMKDGHLNSCKGCDKIYNELNKVSIAENKKQNYKDNRDKRLAQALKRNISKRGELKEYAKKYYKENKKTIVPKKKKYYNDTKKERSKTAKLYRENNKEILKLKSKLYRENNRETLNKSKKKYYENNKTEIILNTKLYRKNNTDKINKKLRERRKENPLYRLTCNVRSLIQKSLKKENYRKNSKSIEILCCSYKYFKTHLEGEFKDWMTWDNYGKYNGELNYGWDIDHKIPLCTAKTEREIIALNHYTNLQPLCSKVNRDIKRGKI